eukprot:5592781-Amphidinium_carterae.2
MPVGDNEEIAELCALHPWWKEWESSRLFHVIPYKGHTEARIHVIVAGQIAGELITVCNHTTCLGGLPVRQGPS